MKRATVFISVLVLLSGEGYAFSSQNSQQNLVKIKHNSQKPISKSLTKQPFSTEQRQGEVTDYSTESIIYPSDRVAQANNNVVSGNAIDIYSSSERMISYRHQEHIWLSDDGAMHLIVNRGNTEQNDSLMLYSSFDSGVTWNPMMPINYTNEQSTSDGYLLNDTLYIVYASGMGKIFLGRLQYDKTNKTWLRLQTRLIYESENFTATNPSIILDNQQRMWAGFVRKNKSTNQYETRIFYSTNNGTSWLDSGLNLGPVNASMARSVKLVRLPDRIGGVYTNQNTINWAERMNNWPPTQEWSAELLFQHEIGSDKDPFASHFSVVVDQLKNIHIATRSNGRLLYLRFDQENQTWDAPQILTNDTSVAYMQVSLSADNRLFTLYNHKTLIGVLESSDYGKNFSLKNLLVHPSASSFNGTADFSQPRMETPSRIGQKLPVIQQFELNGSQSLIYFNVP